MLARASWELAGNRFARMPIFDVQLTGASVTPAHMLWCASWKRATASRGEGIPQLEKGRGFLFELQLAHSNFTIPIFCRLRMSACVLILDAPEYDTFQRTK